METLALETGISDTDYSSVLGENPCEGEIVSSICTLDAAEEALVENGFDAKIEDGFLAVNIGGPERPFTAVLRIAPDNKELLINCQLGVIGDFDESQLAAMAATSNRLLLSSPNRIEENQRQGRGLTKFQRTSFWIHPFVHQLSIYEPWTTI